jgi:hypothetical protein
MAKGKIDPEVLAHIEWLGFVRPTGLVVSAPALVRAGAILDRRDMEGQRLLRELVIPSERSESRDLPAAVGDFPTFATKFLNWSFSPKGYAGTAESPISPELEMVLQDYGETLRPDFAVRELDAKDGAPAWQLLVSVLAPGADFDHVASGHGRLEASPHGRMERLLRHTRVSAGILFNGRALRLIAAPLGESSGWADFRVADMVETAGRPISTALRLLLSESRLLSLPKAQRLAALLEQSRKFQNEVSERLAEQVLHALYELLRGFQAAQDASKGELLREQLGEHSDEVYRGLLTVILRLVFLLYAEERDMLPEGETWLRYYSLAGLRERLREDAALYPDTMDQRYGAWAQLVVLFRMIHDGAAAGDIHLPMRHGVLFDPDRFKFLEGRPIGGARQIHERIEAPLVPDGTIYRALEKLLVLDGERISYRALDVEQIGSVYETMMGFRLETATGRSVAIKAQKKHGAPTAVNLAAMLAEPPARREKWLQDRADRKLSDTVKRAVVAGATVEDLHAALLPVIDLEATPDMVTAGAMVLQPSEERRRSGSHYTPRSLTEPIVRTTLEPILARLRGEDGGAPRPEQILDLKVCDPAMGSGAFLVESCRQLGAALVESWHVHDQLPAIPPDEREDIFAMRLVAQRCLYGVDRNPVAVDLAKMSLWLVTLAKEHPLTFVDHALRHGDSLVGLSRRQIEAFHWDLSKPAYLHGLGIRDSLDAVVELRRQIREAGDDVSDWELRDLWDRAQFELRNVRLVGDLVVAAFFAAEKATGREAERASYAQAVVGGEADRYCLELEEQRTDDPPLAPFHWELEFPEVFERVNPGFGAIVGNPPFAGKNAISVGNVNGYLDWLQAIHEDSHGNSDLVAHFFRRAFNLIRNGGTLGLIATNTVAQGDTRASGLRWICNHEGEIYDARRRVKWPGLAAVVVSVLHIFKGGMRTAKRLDGELVERITAFLFQRGTNADPMRLAANAHKSFQGSILLGMGFTFDDSDTKHVANSLSDMRTLLEQNPSNRDAIFPYIGGDEVLTSPKLANHRFAINFFDYGEADCRRQWPELMAIVEAKVRPERATEGRKTRRERWWQYAEKALGLYEAISHLDRALVNPLYSSHLSFAFLLTRQVFTNKLNVLPFADYSTFCLLQSRVHERWARAFSSTLEDRLAYAPSDCFETFPFPSTGASRLETAGKAYYEFRADLMIRHNEGLTKTYNHFHDPNEQNPDIVELRELHATMDRAVLDAYGWTDVPTDCEFLLDYEIDEDEWGTKKKPWRYRWADDVRDEVLARLLELNAERAMDEARSGAAWSQGGRPAKAATKRAPKRPDTGDLFQ